MPRMLDEKTQVVPRVGAVFLSVILLSLLGCDQLPQWTTPKNHLAEAEKAETGGDYPQAVRSLEASLDGTSATAHVHHRLALIYDDKLNDPVSALHHYRRFLRMAENGSKKDEVERSAKRLEVFIITRLGESGLVTKTEAVKLRNENLELRRQLAQLRGEKPPPREKTDTKGFSTNPTTRAAEAVIGKETRTYVVEKGDTLASISRKFYQTPNRWKDIADANHNALGGGTALKVGQTIIIP